MSLLNCRIQLLCIMYVLDLIFSLLFYKTFPGVIPAPNPNSRNQRGMVGHRTNLRAFSGGSPSPLVEQMMMTVGACWGVPSTQRGGDA